ncbi:hypothetical protein CMQ_1952 [Grosmannia clavigera kw1407]|uniref:Uncharacterized protein n=1 Tax=Grosmannia clavigera (strain kw1407 / UAMH 11150) TaxID=655863 RepID=F0XNC8_GROCL|nr:uncharacterized protein CMQ_1952 [Grosmannia clavigera kw1407]EFX00871.1 hypothetical protein CMQ_1952 [Grosmannia clavigera kw1407]
MAQSVDAGEVTTDNQQYASSVQVCNGSMNEGRQTASVSQEDSRLRAERLRTFTEDTSGINDRFMAIANAPNNAGGTAP